MKKQYIFLSHDVDWGYEGPSKEHILQRKDRFDKKLFDTNSTHNLYRNFSEYMEIEEKDVSIGHEASVGKVSEEQLFYLMSRGFSEEQALGMIVRGFMDAFVRELPMEYAVELNRLIELNMEGSVG